MSNETKQTKVAEAVSQAVPSTINGIHIGDVHWGHGPAEQTEKEMDLVISYVQNPKYNIQYVTVTGDYFHKKLVADSKAYLGAYNKLLDLAEYCLQNGIKMRVLQGTLTHDCEMLKVFQRYEDGNFFRLISKVEEEELFSGVNVLYIPEEYPDDAKEYYKEYFAKQYDLIFGHGTFEFQAHTAQMMESERGMAGAPIFSEKEMVKRIRGFCIFGHIHTHCSYANKIFYHGSLARDCHGEEKPKGFLFSQFKKTEKGIGKSVKFIENKLARKFVSVDYSDVVHNLSGELGEEVTVENASVIIQDIQAKLKTVQFLRLVIDVAVPDEIIHFIRQAFSTNKAFKVHKKFDTKVTIDTDVDIMNEGVDALDPADDENLIEIESSVSDIDATISEFAKKAFSEDITIDRIKELAEAE